MYQIFYSNTFPLINYIMPAYIGVVTNLKYIQTIPDFRLMVKSRLLPRIHNGSQLPVKCATESRLTLYRLGQTLRHHSKGKRKTLKIFLY